jgi:peptidoglycan/LPS O-acetylase OafA/YrhL
MNGLNMNWQSFFQYFFYAANVPLISGATLPFLNHYWSLGVEEQFYLFWPWLNKISARYLLPVILFLIVLLIGLKLYLHFLHPGSLLESIIQITRFHCMMIGGAGAILYRIHHKLFLKIADNKITQAVAWIALFLIAINRFHIGSVIDNEIVSVIALLIIVGQINIKNRLVKLETGILNFLGKISYGIYVIHPLVIFAISKLLANAFKPSVLKYIIVYATVMGATTLIAYLSYHYFESYFLKIKKKFMVVKSTN